MNAFLKILMQHMQPSSIVSFTYNFLKSTVFSQMLAFFSLGSVELSNRLNLQCYIHPTYM